MNNFSATFGFIIESDKPGNYYDRLGMWSPYDSPAMAYVWTVEELSQIAKSSTNEGWPIMPDTVHPALYDNRTGVTIITGPAKKLASLFLPVNIQIPVPSTKGQVFDISVSTGILGINAMGGVSHSI